MMARSPTSSNQRPDTLMQNRSPPTRRKPLATHGRTIHWVSQNRSSIRAAAGGKFSPVSGGGGGIRVDLPALHPSPEKIIVWLCLGPSDHVSAVRSGKGRSLELV